MNKHCCFFPFLAGLACILANPVPALTAPAHADPLPAAGTPASVADTPAVAVVRQFLADRAAGKYDAAYALLSVASHKRLPERAWTAFSLPNSDEYRKLPAPKLGLVALLFDPENTMGYTFIVIGPASDDPDVVLVRAEPHAQTEGVPPVTLRILTVADPGIRMVRLDLVGSLNHHEPKEFPQMSERARRALSQSNLKRLSLGIIEYEQDSDEKMPDAARWVDEIMVYIKSVTPFRDPSAPVGQKWNYAYNSALSHKFLAQFDAPAQTVMLFESSKGVKNASDTGQSVPRPGWHLGGTDYAFADGHVKWFADGTKLSYRLDGK